MVVAEIGCFDGSTTLDYADIISRNDGTLYIVDWFKGASQAVDPSHVHRYNPDGSEELQKVFEENLKDYLDIIHILAGKSEDKIPEIPDDSLDICFIDADHSYKHVYQDISLALPKVKKGGIICGHDFENINLANHFSPEQLADDDYPQLTPEQIQIQSPASTWPQEHVHAGSIQAVFDHFGYDVEHREDPFGHGIPIWVKPL